MHTTAFAHGTLPESTGFARWGHVVLGGIPFGRGALQGGGAFTLETGGRAFPVDGAPSAWWPDGSVKWLRLCGAVDLAGGDSNPFELHQPREDDPAPAAALVVRHLPGIVEVTSPQLTVRIRPDAQRALRVLDAAGRPLTRGPGLSAMLAPAAPEGAARPPVHWTFEPPGQRVVEQSPARVIVRLAGRFVEAGRVLAELVTFIEIVRDEPRLGIQPVLIYLGDPDRDAIARLDVAVHTVFGGEEGFFGFGQDAGPGYWDACRWIPDGHDWPRARLLQSGSTFCRLDKRTGPEGSWVKIREGRRAPGWCHLGDASGGATGALRYFWQEYPRSLEVDADAGTLTFGLVPPSGEPLDLRRYSPALLGATIYETGEGAFPAQSHGATGIAKASAIMVRFHAAGSPREEAMRAGRFWCDPVRIIPDPAAFAASGVAGVLAAAAPPSMTAAEMQLASLVDFMLAEREARGWYGLMDFGDWMQSFLSDRDQWAFDDGGYGWVNSEALPDLGLWLMALRHGRPDWLEAAIAMTRHNRDVDMYHRGNFKGVGSRHNVNHWGCKDKEWRVSMPLVKRFHHYLTGDPWTREVILETAAVYQSYARTSRTAPSMVSGLCGLMVKAELTGEPADHAIVRRAMEVFAAAVRPDGHLVNSVRIDFATGEGQPVLESPEPADDASGTLLGSYFFFQGFGGQHTLVELAETYRHAGLLAALVRHADIYLQPYDAERWKAYQAPSARQSLAVLALAWRQTGEARFKEAIEEALLNGWHGPALAVVGSDGAEDTPRHRAMDNLKRRNKITCSIGERMHQTPYGYAIMCE